MKKLFILTIAILFTSLCFPVNAQTSMTGSGDTIVNTGTKTNTLKLNDNFKRVTIQSVVTKISGTVAGTLTLQGSVNGTNYVTIDTGAVVSEKVTFTATNVATQSTVFIVNDSPYLYYRVSYTGTGTMSASMSSVLLPRSY